ncbi:MULTISPECIES: porin [Azohydromonas]|uniref:Porin n=1 Tax=Azohydromonas lata TaxID=45677 RepID=A0ABU5I7K5_9BURK|nr:MULTISPECIES: porin [Azohydromonas]MDZ5455086.1 porin [Azohydromonas lata]
MCIKHVLSAVMLAAGAGLASAQSSVVLFGKIDSGYVNKIGTKTARGDKGLGEGAQSRFGLRGSENLGNGLSAFYWLENRFKSDTGELTTARFFQGQSILGLKGPWGTVTMGRDYIAGYVEVQMAPDPFIHTGVSSMVAFGNGNIGTVRNDGAISYKVESGPLSFVAQWARDTNPNSATLPGPLTAEHPVGASAWYQAGPLFLGYSYENPGGVHDVWHFAAMRAVLGPVTLSAGYGQGETNTQEERRSWVVGAHMPVGGGRLKVVYGDLRNTSASLPISRKMALGYNYNFSKRTFVYLNIARDRDATADRNGFDVGVQHNF